MAGTARAGLAADHVPRKLAARRGGLARATVVAMEHGARAVHPDELGRLADLCGRPLHGLLRRQQPADFAAQLRSSLAQQGLEAPDAAAAIGAL